MIECETDWPRFGFGNDFAKSGTTVGPLLDVASDLPKVQTPVGRKREIFDAPAITTASC